MARALRPHRHADRPARTDTARQASDETGSVCSGELRARGPGSGWLRQPPVVPRPGPLHEPPYAAAASMSSSVKAWCSAICRNWWRSSFVNVSSAVETFGAADISSADGRPAFAGPSSSPMRTSTYRCARRTRSCPLSTASASSRCDLTLHTNACTPRTPVPGARVPGGGPLALDSAPGRALVALGVTHAWAHCPSVSRPAARAPGRSATTCDSTEGGRSAVSPRKVRGMLRKLPTRANASKR